MDGVGVGWSGVLSTFLGFAALVRVRERRNVQQVLRNFYTGKTAYSNAFETVAKHLTRTKQPIQHVNTSQTSRSTVHLTAREGKKPQTH